MHAAEPTQCTIKIPIRIVSDTSKHKKIQKMLINSYLNTKQIPELPIYVTLTRYDPIPINSDNLQTAFKYVRDAISEYVIGATKAGSADSDPRIEWNYLQEKTTDKDYFITIEIHSTSFVSNESANTSINL